MDTMDSMDSVDEVYFGDFEFKAIVTTDAKELMETTS